MAAREKNVNTMWRKETEEDQQAGRSVNWTDLQDLWAAKGGLSSEKLSIDRKASKKGFRIPFKLCLGRETGLATAKDPAFTAAKTSPTRTGLGRLLSAERQ